MNSVLLKFQATGLLMTLCGILGAVLALAILVFMPVAIQFIGLGAYAKALLRIFSFTLLIMFVATSLSLLYHFGPSRRSAKWHWITPGSSVATLLGLIGFGSAVALCRSHRQLRHSMVASAVVGVMIVSGCRPMRFYLARS